MFRIGIDVGGTFTDLVAVDDAGRVTIAKSASTPADPSIGAMDGLGLLAGELGLELAGLLGGTRLIVHGTTVATTRCWNGRVRRSACSLPTGTATSSRCARA